MNRKLYINKPIPEGMNRDDLFSLAKFMLVQMAHLGYLLNSVEQLFPPKAWRELKAESDRKFGEIIPPFVREYLEEDEWDFRVDKGYRGQDDDNRETPLPPGWVVYDGENKS